MRELAAVGSACGIEVLRRFRRRLLIVGWPAQRHLHANTHGASIAETADPSRIQDSQMANEQHSLLECRPKNGLTRVYHGPLVET